MTGMPAVKAITESCLVDHPPLTEHGVPAVYRIETASEGITIWLAPPLLAVPQDPHQDSDLLIVEIRTADRPGSYLVLAPHEVE